MNLRKKKSDTVKVKLLQLSQADNSLQKGNYGYPGVSYMLPEIVYAFTSMYANTLPFY